MRRALAAVVVAAAAAASCDEPPPRPAVTPEAYLASFQRTIDPKAPGPAELPGDLLPMPFPWARWTVVAVAALVGAALLVRHRRRRPIEAPASPVAAPGPPPQARALRRLAELRARRPMSAVDVHVEAATVVREYVGERFRLPTAQMTSVEIVAATATPHRTRLADVLARCDGVKFACDAPGVDDAERLLASAETFVTATSSAGGAA